MMAALLLLAPGLALIALIALIVTAVPDPTRAVHASPERPRSSSRRHGRGRSRRRGRPI